MAERIGSILVHEELPPWLEVECNNLEIEIVDSETPLPNQALRWRDDRLSICFPNDSQGDVLVDFCSSASEHRRLKGGAYGQPVAKAIGLSPSVRPLIMDMTAGLGRDAFVLASLGATVRMCERHAIVYLLLKDGLRRGQMEPGEVGDICSRMSLLSADSHTVDLDPVDVVFVDPMFPARQKSAAVKKDMAAFHSLVGMDEDSDGLLSRAMSCAEYRVVVKRPKKAPYLSGQKPSVEHKGKSGRFDIYTKKAMKPQTFKSVASL